MKSRLISSTCLLALVTTLSSAPLGQPLEIRFPAMFGDMSAVPVAVWVAVIGLIGLDVIARRSSAGN